MTQGEIEAYDRGYEAGSAFAECDAQVMLHDARVLLQWIRTERVNAPMVNERIDAYFRQVSAVLGAKGAEDASQNQ